MLIKTELLRLNLGSGAYPYRSFFLGVTRLKKYWALYPKVRFEPRLKPLSTDTLNMSREGIAFDCLSRRQPVQEVTMGRVIEVQDDNFNETVINSALPVEVDFWAPSCDPCHNVAPIYDRLATEYEGRFQFCKVNVDENRKCAEQYRIGDLPVQLFFVGGERIDVIYGMASELFIRCTVDSILQQYPDDAWNKLKRLLATWVESNQQFVEAFNGFMASVAGTATKPGSASIVEVVKQLDVQNHRLAKILQET
jgi:thioredoxin 1